MEISRLNILSTASAGFRSRDMEGRNRIFNLVTQLICWPGDFEKRTIVLLRWSGHTANAAQGEHRNFIRVGAQTWPGEDVCRWNNEQASVYALTPLQI